MLGFIAAIATPIGVVLFLASRKPDSFRLERSTRVHAPPGEVASWIEDFRRWVDWSPWEHLDPALKRTYGGEPRGVGAVYEWDGNKRAGKGRMEIVGVEPGRKVTIKLDFLEPFEAHNTAEFSLEPVGDATEVRWAMFGPSPFLSKVMSVFFDMEKTVGPDFEKGLAALKARAEGTAEGTARTA